MPDTSLQRPHCPTGLAEQQRNTVGLADRNVTHEQALIALKSALDAASVGVPPDIAKGVLSLLNEQCAQATDRPALEAKRSKGTAVSPLGSARPVATGRLDLSTLARAAIALLTVDVGKAVDALAKSRGTPITDVVLPAGQNALPPAVSALNALTRLEMPEFAGLALDLRRLRPGVQVALGKAPRLLQVQALASHHLELAPSHPVKVTDARYPNADSRTPSKRTALADHAHVLLPKAWYRDAKAVEKAFQETMEVRLNFKVPFPGTDRLIVCRELALEVLDRWMRNDEVARTAGAGAAKSAAVDGSLGRRFSFDGFTSPEALALTVNPKWTEIEARIRSTAQINHLVALSELTAFVQSQFKEMKPGDARYFLMLSSNHMMGLRLRYENQPGAPRGVWTFYDPYLTATHVRKKMSDPISGRCEIGELMDARTVGDYFGANPDGHMAHLIQVEPAMLKSAPPDAGRPDRKLTIWQPPGPRNCTPVEVFLRLTNGLSAGLAERLSTTLRSLRADQQFELMMARNYAGIPALHTALQNGHATAVTALLQAVSQAKLTADQRFELLMAKDPNGIPGLQLALLNGHAEAVTAYLQAASRTELNLDLRLEFVRAGLLMALENGRATAVSAVLDAALGTELSADHFSLFLENGLHFALINGRAEAVTALLQAAAQTKLNADQRFKLMMAKNEKGTPGLFLAMQNGQAAAVSALMQAVARTTLTQDQRFALLMAMNAKGTPGLYFAMQNGHAAAVSALLQAPSLPQLTADQCLKLLMAKSSAGIPGLYFALQNGHAEAVKALLHAASLAMLKENHGFELLIARDGRGIPGLHMALKNGHAAAVEELLQAVSRTELTQDQRFELLMAKNAKGTPGLYLAMQEGHAAAAFALLQAAAQIKLDRAQRFELLRASGPDGVPALVVSLQKGHVAVKAWLEAVLQSDLSDADKGKLLWPEGFADTIRSQLRTNSALARVWQQALLPTQLHQLATFHLQTSTPTAAALPPASSASASLPEFGSPDFIRSYEKDPLALAGPGAPFAKEVQSVLTSALSVEVQQDRLVQRDEQGRPLLFKLMQVNATPGIETLAAACLDPRFGSDRAGVLLAWDRSTQMSSLSQAMAKGNTLAVQAWMGAALQLALPEWEKEALLLGRGAMAHPGVMTAVEHAGPDLGGAVTAWVQCIAKAPDHQLSTASKTRLLKHAGLEGPLSASDQKHTRRSASAQGAGVA